MVQNALSLIACSDKSVSYNDKAEVYSASLTTQLYPGNPSARTQILAHAHQLYSSVGRHRNNLSADLKTLKQTA